MMQIIRRSDWTAMPWKNGGGLTYDIAMWPEGSGFDGFQWRLSAAEVARDGPFSRFEGIDRMMAILSGPGLVLDGVPGQPMRLTPDTAPFAFPGEAPVTGRLVDGPVLDLNLMVRRETFAPAMNRVVLSGAIALEPRPVTLVHVMAGEAAVHSGANRGELSAGDTAICDEAGTVRAEGATLLIIGITGRG